MSSIANFSTLIVNDPDFTRFATRPQDALWSQFFAIRLFPHHSVGILGVNSDIFTSDVFCTDIICGHHRLLLLDGNLQRDNLEPTRHPPTVSGRRRLVEPRGRVLHRHGIRPGPARHQHRRKLRLGGHRHDRAAPAIHQHPPRRVHMRSRRLRNVPLAAPEFVEQFHHLPVRLQRLLIFHCWRHDLRLLSR